MPNFLGRGPMRPARGDGPSVGGWIALIPWLAGALLFASAPLILGVIVTVMVPGLELRPGTPVIVAPVYLVGAIVVGTIFGGRLDRAVRSSLAGRRFWAEIGSEAASTALLWLLLLPLMADGRSAFVAAVVSNLLFKGSAPLLVWMERRRNDDR